MTLLSHPVADVFPMMSPEEFRDLVNSIEENGQREPVWLHPDGRIVDGRNRAAACDELGIEPATRTYEGDDAGLVRFVLDLNLHRRHLTESQRAWVAAQVANLQRGDNQHTAREDGSIDLPSDAAAPVSQSSAADMLSVSVPSVKRAAQVRDYGTDEMRADVQSGELSVSAASAIVKEAEKDPARVAELYEERKAAPHVTNNSGENEWYTPLEFIAAARAVMGSIDLDPATSATANENVGAALIYTADDDGLAQEWHGNVWMNPPYSGGLMPKFADKLAEEFEAGRVTQACVLVNNGTETGWMHVMGERATAICLLKGRVSFWYPGRASKTPLQGQVVLYLGDNLGGFREEFGPLGLVATF